MATVVLACLLLAGCGSRSDGDPAPAAQEVPTVAATMPATVADPAATRALLTFAGRDADHDGFVTAIENASAADKIFDAIDADQDGNVTDQEYTAARVALGLTSLPGSEELIAQADQDGDGKLTLAEWIASEGQAFRAADRNGDGKLDPAEWDGMPRLVGAKPDAVLLPSSAPTEVASVAAGQ
jgi:outer membrane murein-binding lipoprotein Lpp